jgi:hypothetical protein
MRSKARINSASGSQVYFILEREFDTCIYWFDSYLSIGLYEIKTKSCFRFDQATYKFDTTAPAPLALHATHFLATGTIKTPRICAELDVTATGASSVVASLLDSSGTMISVLKRFFRSLYCINYICYI